MLGETWSGSDIDIFIPNNHLFDGYWPSFTDLHKELYKRSYDPEHNRFSTYSSDGQYDEKLGKNVILRIYDYRTINLTNKIIKFEVMDLNLETDINNVIKFIDDNFDFDFCKNKFYYDENSMNINIVAPLQVMTKIGEFRYRKSLKSSLARCKKYIDRGFVFKNEHGEPFDPGKILSFDYH